MWLVHLRTDGMYPFVLVAHTDAPPEQFARELAPGVFQVDHAGEDWRMASELADAELDALDDTLRRLAPRPPPEIAYGAYVSALIGPRPPYVFSRTPTPLQNQRIAVFEAERLRWTATSVHVPSVPHFLPLGGAQPPLTPPGSPLRGGAPFGGKI